MTRPLSRALLCITALFALAVSSSALPAATTKKKPKPVDIKKALATELPRAVIGGKLPRALTQFGAVINVPVVANWTDLGTVGVTRDTSVSIRVSKKITADKLLDLLLMRVSPKGKPLSWYESGGVIVVSTQSRVLRRKSTKRAAASRKPATNRISGTRLRTHSFKAEPLSDVISFYRNLTDVNFHVNWKALANVGIDKEEPITLVAKGISISRALNIITAQLSEGKDRYESVYWMVNRGVVTMTTGHALNTNTILTIHEVGDLLFTAPNFKGPRLGRSTKGAGDDSSDNAGVFDVSSGGGDGTGMEDEDAAQMRQKTKDALQKIITDSIGDEMWIDGGGKGSVRYFRNKLIISQTRLGYMLMKKAGVLDGFKQIK
jgi:hypothetical protein